MKRRHALGAIAACSLPLQSLPVQALPTDPDLGPAALPAPLQALLQREPAAIDIATAATRIAQLLPTPAASPQEAERFTLVVQAARSRLAQAQPGSPHAALRALNGFLFDEFGLHVSADTASPADPLPALLSTRAGSVAALATFYLAVAQRLGLPVQAVAAPGHRFLRLVLPGQAPHNIELTLAGAPMSDEQYIRRFAIAPRSLASGAYLRTLDHREYLAALLVPVGMGLQRQRQPAMALAVLDAARHINPRDPDGMHRMAHFWLDAARDALDANQRDLAGQRLGRASAYQRQAEALGWSPGPTG